MTRCSVQPNDRIFVRGYWFLSFARNMGRNIVKNVSKKLNSNYSQTFFDHTKQSDTDPLKNASKKAIQKTAEVTGDLIGKKFVDKVAKVSKTSVKNNSETNEEEILRKRYISPELRHKIIDDLKLKEKNYW